MNNSTKLKLADQYYLEHKDEYEAFAKNVFEEDGAGYINTHYKILFNDIPYVNNNQFPNITFINICSIIHDLFLYNPQFVFMDQFVKAMILQKIISGKNYFNHFKPMRFIGKDASSKRYRYLNSRIHSMTMNHILYNLNYYSNKYNIDRDIIRIVVINHNTASWIENKKFKHASPYNDLKYLLYSHSDYRIPREIELAALGKNYYKSSLGVEINGKGFYIKRGETWFFAALVKIHEYLHNSGEDLKIKVISFENFDIDDLHNYIQNNYPGYENRICNALSRFISGTEDYFVYGITKNEMIDLIYNSKSYIRGIGEKSKEIMKGYFYPEEVKEN